MKNVEQDMKKAADMLIYLLKQIAEFGNATFDALRRITKVLKRIRVL